MWQTPVSKMSPMNVTPRSSSVARAASTSSTCSAIGLRLTWYSRPMRSGTITLNVRLPVSNSAKPRSGMCTEHGRPSVSA